MAQLSFFSSVIQSAHQTKSHRFLEQMENIIPWKIVVELIDDVINKNNRGRKRKPTLLMFKCLCLQQWYNLSDPALEDQINDRASFQKFLNLDLSAEQAPDETTIVKFRHLLERHQLTEKIFNQVNELLLSQCLLLKQGTIIDSTIVQAPSSTKNKEKQRDDEMSSTKKNNQYYFGMKVHTGVDGESGLVHTVKVSTAKEHDSNYFEEMLHGDEEYVSADKAYFSKERQRNLKLKGVYSAILVKVGRGKKLSCKQKRKNRQYAKIRSKVEHPFGVVKNLWKHKKVRYKGLSKNASQQFLLFTLHNLYKLRKQSISLCGV